MAQPADSPFRWNENRRPSVFVTDPNFRATRKPLPAVERNLVPLGCIATPVVKQTREK